MLCFCRKVGLYWAHSWSCIWIGLFGQKGGLLARIWRVIFVIGRLNLHQWFKFERTLPFHATYDKLSLANYRSLDRQITSKLRVIWLHRLSRLLYSSLFYNINFCSILARINLLRKVCLLHRFVNFDCSGRSVRQFKVSFIGWKQFRRTSMLFLNLLL